MPVALFAPQDHGGGGITKAVEAQPVAHADLVGVLVVEHGHEQRRDRLAADDERRAVVAPLQIETGGIEDQ